MNIHNSTLKTTNIFFFLVLSLKKKLYNDIQYFAAFNLKLMILLFYFF